MNAQTNSPDEFHPGLNDSSATYVDRSLRTRVHHIKGSDLSSARAGLRRLAAITGGSVGSERIWMGETWVSPETVSDHHHHGESETAIFVRSGNPEFVFHDGVGEAQIVAAPGDYIFVPPYLLAPRREPAPPILR